MTEAIGRYVIIDYPAKSIDHWLARNPCMEGRSIVVDRDEVPLPTHIAASVLQRSGLCELVTEEE